MTTHEYRSYICNNKIINLLQGKPIGFMWICDFMTIIHSIKTKKAVGNRFRWLFCFNRMYRTYVVSRLRNACLS